MRQPTRVLRRALLAAAIILGSGAAMGINDDNGCGPTPGDGGECSAASDCGGVPPIDCTGAWECQGGECVWECNDAPPTGCYTDDDCGNDQHCNAEEVCLLPPGCGGDATDCPVVCYGFCHDDEPPADVCWSDSNCQDDEQCNTWDYCLDEAGNNHGGASDAGEADRAAFACGGMCEPKETPPDVCWGDGDCGANEQCNTWDQCLGADGNPATPGPQSFLPGARLVCGGLCEPVGCTSDQECGDGFYCGCPLNPMANGLVVGCETSVCLPEQGPITCDDLVCPPNSVCQEQCDDDCGCPPGVECDCISGPQTCTASCFVVEPPDVCENVECGAGNHCETVCAAAECDCVGVPGEDCGCTDYCEPICVPDDVEPIECSSDADCDSDEYCGCGDGPWSAANGLVCFPQCLPKDPEPTECSSDDDCSASEYCGCGAGPWGLPNGIACYLQCLPKDEPTEDCQYDWQCGGGETCVIDYCTTTDADGDSAADPIPCDGAQGPPGCGGSSCFGHCEEEPNDWECSTNQQCSSGNVCIYQYCEAVACGPNEDCDYQELCYGSCEPDHPPVWECSSDDQCESGQCDFVVCETDAAGDPACDNPDDCGASILPPQCYGYCAPQEPQACDSAGQCPDGFTCGCGNWGGGGWGGFYPSAIPCMPMCHPDEPTDECHDDGDCGTGSSCVASPTGNVCKPVVTGECQTDEQCWEGSYCELTNCTTVCPDCDANGDCPPCESECWGECKDADWPQQCSDENDCDDGENCTCTPDPSCPMCDVCFFQCVPDAVPPEACYGDGDCSNGEVCGSWDCGPGDGCAFGADCPDSVCVGKCEEPQQQILECNDDGTCNDGFACVCGPDPDCPMCTVCVMQCLPTLPPQGDSCSSDSQCSDGEHCDMGVCPMFLPCMGDQCPGCEGQCKPDEDEPTECVVTGCSGQVCAAEPMPTTCEWLPYYACFALSDCGEREYGGCGWQPNAEFLNCMDEFGAIDQ